MQPAKIKRAEPATKTKEGLSCEIPPDDRDICMKFLAFPDSFAIDWFAGIPDVSPSRLISALSFLERRQWIMARPGEKGIYEWTEKLPREEIIGGLPPAEMAGYYRCAANLLQQQVPATKETLLKAAQLSLLAGMREQDLSAVFQAALTEEENHKISSAIHLYECLLKFVAELAQENRGQLSRQTIAILIKAIERRASLSLFHPNLKQINHFLSMAIRQADEIEDTLAQASLHLLIGQNYWMAFQHEQAVEHFDMGWRMIEKGEKNALYRRGLQLQALASWIRGDLPGAVQAYEDSLGELDSVAVDDFSQLIALHLALCYTQVGMPQRGLGISETIYNQAKKTRMDRSSPAPWPPRGSSFSKSASSRTAGPISKWPSTSRGRRTSPWRRSWPASAWPTSAASKATMKRLPNISRCCGNCANRAGIIRSTARMSSKPAIPSTARPSPRYNWIPWSTSCIR